MFEAATLPHEERSRALKNKFLTQRLGAVGFLRRGGVFLRDRILDRLRPRIIDDIRAMDERTIAINNRTSAMFRYGVDVIPSALQFLDEEVAKKEDLDRLEAKLDAILAQLDKKNDP